MANSKEIRSIMYLVIGILAGTLSIECAFVFLRRFVIDLWAIINNRNPSRITDIIISGKSTKGVFFKAHC